MQKCGMSLEETPCSQLGTSNAAEHVDRVSGMCSMDTTCKDRPSEVERSVENMVTCACFDNNEETASPTMRMEQDPEVQLVCDAVSPKKRQKVIIPGRSSTTSEASENSILNWLKNYDEGVSSTSAQLNPLH